MKQFYYEEPQQVIDKVWGLYNYNNLVYVARLRRDCVSHAEELSGEEWSKCKKYLQVRKVTVTAKFTRWR